MKILVFSDSHGSTRLMEHAVRTQHPDMLLHLGDVVRDAQALALAFPALPMDYVSGNCDFTGDVPPGKTIILVGRKILLTHGHIYQVKTGIDTAVRAALEQEADILLFGHTHQALCDRAGALWILNPGSIRDGVCPTYGVIELEPSKPAKIMCRTVLAT